MPIRVVLFDLDGVIRQFNPDDVTAIEKAHELAPGTIASAAFSSPLANAVTTGRITRREWIDKIGTLIGSRSAADAWGRLEASLDSEVIALAEKVRDLGNTTAILTNGTDTIPDELHQLGVTDHFDHVFNSAEIGFSKPDVRAFKHVLTELGAVASDVFFTDDSAGKLTGAQTLGMKTHLFGGARRLRTALRETGIDV